MRYVPRHRLRVLMAMFFVTGPAGIGVGLLFAPPYLTVMITFLGVINVGLGAFFAYLYLTQPARSPDKRKKRRDRRDGRDDAPSP